MNENWKQDPRLKGMNEQKIKYLTDLAAQIERTPKDKLMPMLLSIAAGNNNMNFNDQETDLLVSILTSKMSPAQKKQVETFRVLSQQLGQRGKK